MLQKKELALVYSARSQGVLQRHKVRSVKIGLSLYFAGFLHVIIGEFDGWAAVDGQSGLAAPCDSLTSIGANAPGESRALAQIR